MGWGFDLSKIISLLFLLPSKRLCQGLCQGEVSSGWLDWLMFIYGNLQGSKILKTVPLPSIELASMLPSRASMMRHPMYRLRYICLVSLFIRISPQVMSVKVFLDIPQPSSTTIRISCYFAWSAQTLKTIGLLMENFIAFYVKFSTIYCSLTLSNRHLCGTSASTLKWNCKLRRFAASLWQQMVSEIAALMSKTCIIDLN